MNPDVITAFLVGLPVGAFLFWIATLPDQKVLERERNLWKRNYDSLARQQAKTASLWEYGPPGSVPNPSRPSSPGKPADPRQPSSPS